MKVSSTVMIISTICLVVALVSSNSNKEVAFQEDIIGQGPDMLCGQTSYTYGNDSANLCPRIVGGCPAKPGQFPFQVSVWDQLNGIKCGGIIFDDEHILTAAHCFNYLVPSTPETTIVTIGDHLRFSVDGEEIVYISTITVHENYARRVQIPMNDIALLKTSTRMIFKLTSDGYGSVNQPCMPNSENVTYREGEDLLVSGWGTIDPKIPWEEDILRWVKVPYVTIEECQKSSYGNEVNEDHVCAGYKQGGNGSCYGDSGGPLVRQIEGGRFELVGIVSSGGHGCVAPNEPGIYTRVASFINWINANL